MQLTKFNGNTVKHVKDVPGLLTVEYEHKIQETKATFLYAGPPIPPAVWNQVLSFFKWTYDTTKSESQVRLYVNHELRQWAAWAFPQEARTGMSAREVQGPEFDKQRALFKCEEGWFYFGTVHHHCSAGAFQSGTDFNNEESQDGLHITVGKMDSPVYDIHCRFYLNKNHFTPDMSLFWDVGDQVRGMLPNDLHDRVARHQMCVPPATPEFPDIWKTNLIEIKTVVTHYPGGFDGGFSSAGYRGSGGSGSYAPGGKYSLPDSWAAEIKNGEDVRQWTEWRKAKAACVMLSEYALNCGYSYREMYDYVEWANKQPDLTQLAFLCCKYHTTIGEIWRELPYSEPAAYKAAFEKVTEGQKEFHPRKGKKKGKAVTAEVIGQPLLTDGNSKPVSIPVTSTQEQPGGSKPIEPDPDMYGHEYY